MQYFLLINIITLLVFVNGCIEPQSYNSSNGLLQKSYINFTFDDIENKINSCNTEIRCNDLVETQLNNKYITWKGQVSDVTNDAVYVNVENNFSSNRRGEPSYNIDIRLFGIDKQTKLNLNPGDRVIFSGKFYLQNEIKIVFYNYENTIHDYKTIWKKTQRRSDLEDRFYLDITDAEIISINPPMPTPIPTSHIIYLP